MHCLSAAPCRATEPFRVSHPMTQPLLARAEALVEASAMRHPGVRALTLSRLCFAVDRHTRLRWWLSPGRPFCLTATFGRHDHHARVILYPTLSATGPLWLALVPGHFELIPLDFARPTPALDRAATLAHRHREKTTPREAVNRVGKITLTMSRKKPQEATP